jgi:hypothetical protein
VGEAGEAQEVIDRDGRHVRPTWRPSPVIPPVIPPVVPWDNRPL